MKTPIDPNSSFRNLFFRPWQFHIILLAFLVNSLGPMPVYAADEFRLPAPGVRVALSPEYNPPILKGIKVHPDNPFRFDFILDQGDLSVIPAQATAKAGQAGMTKKALNSISTPPCSSNSKTRPALCR